jgi:hypothetical protein
MEATMFELSDWGAGTWLWLVIDVGAVVILGIALLYASRMWWKERGDRANREVTERATRDLYETEAKREERKASQKI